MESPLSPKSPAIKYRIVKRKSRVRKSLLVITLLKNVKRQGIPFPGDEDDTDEEEDRCSSPEPENF
jgi:hypothetical protein